MLIYNLHFALPEGSALKHAGSNALALLHGLLDDIRLRNGLVEKKPGVFYRKNKAFLHFHEDPAGMFMDIRDGQNWLRVPAAEQARCLHELDRILASG